jgi:hypothetical protein
MLKISVKIAKLYLFNLMQVFMGELVPFIPHPVNGVNVDQRMIDGFINGTAMCVAHDKNIVDWFRTERTYALFACVFNNFSLNSNMVSHHDLDISRLSATKYAEIFPGLVYVKRGSPMNGGGVWLHPDLSIDLASFCNPPFAIQVSRWVREWFVTGKNPVQPTVDLEQEYADWQERYDIRIELKDILRPELMEATRAYAVANKFSPVTLCSKVHDAMNERIQGAKAKEIRTLNGLPLFALLRDHFDTRPLHIYAAINRIAINRIVDAKVNPIEAVHQACDLYLGARYTPKLVPKVENLYVEGRRILKARKAQQLKSSNYNQLSLFPNDEAV